MGIRVLGSNASHEKGSGEGTVAGAEDRQEASSSEQTQHGGSSPAKMGNDPSINYNLAIEGEVDSATLLRMREELRNRAELRLNSRTQDFSKLEAERRRLARSGVRVPLLRQSARQAHEKYERYMASERELETVMRSWSAERAQIKDSRRARQQRIMRCSRMLGMVREPKPLDSLFEGINANTSNKSKENRLSNGAEEKTTRKFQVI